MSGRQDADQSDTDIKECQGELFIILYCSNVLIYVKGVHRWSMDFAEIHCYVLLK